MDNASSEFSDSEPEYDSLEELDYNLQSLTARSRPTYTSKEKCKVLYWLKTGKYRADCFVQYGKNGCHVHRIEPAEYHNFDAIKCLESLLRAEGFFRKIMEHGNTVKKISEQLPRLHGKFLSPTALQHGSMPSTLRD
ncbi:hypothetical protein CIRG_09925 [Coccidioides immitis RMSCC 2394]|uniref:Uncharacterized protein n=1 Tax=Coccidioides immitis RMSCC 2394 TaxID=404692 RepID=A0A0J6YSG8_COCIT|nr:hypothetical protein CIRG_09925 [Coccidioides immitis RMSCC 2394]